MLTPETDAIRINRLVNDPSIKPYVCGQISGVLDVTILVNNPKNIFFCGEHGGCGFIWMEEGQYELHSFVLPEGRGRWARDNFRLCLEWIWANTGATQIVTLCPQNNRPAIGAARICGFTKYATIPDAWLFDGLEYDIDSYVLYKGVG